MLVGGGHGVRTVFLSHSKAVNNSSAMRCPKAFRLFSCSRRLVEGLGERKVGMFSFAGRPKVSRKGTVLPRFVRRLAGFNFSSVFVYPRDRDRNYGYEGPGANVLVRNTRGCGLGLRGYIIVNSE